MDRFYRLLVTILLFPIGVAVSGQDRILSGTVLEDTEGGV